MNLFGAMLITFASVLLGTGTCFWLLHHARDVDTTLWIFEHIVCPIIRILVLLIVVSQIYPVIEPASSSLEFWRVLGRQGQFNHLVNILFFGGLLLAFLPVVNHPVIMLPLISMFTIAVVFHWQYAGIVDSLALFPSTATLLKIFGYMALAYFVARELSTRLARWIDRRYALEGSIRLVSDALYLTLQVPVMLIYSSFLKSQLG